MAIINEINSLTKLVYNLSRGPPKLLSKCLLARPIDGSLKCSLKGPLRGLLGCPFKGPLGGLP